MIAKEEGGGIACGGKGDGIMAIVIVIVAITMLSTIQKLGRDVNVVTITVVY